MKKQVRRGVFETNSSSVHSLTLVMKDEYEKWEKGELVYNDWENKLVPVTEEIKKKMELDGKCSDYFTYEQFYDYEYNEFKTYENLYTTPSGEEVVAFGYYGDNY